MTTTEPLLDVRAVRRSFDGLLALDGATISVQQGSITALIGPNGAGKTTLFNAVAGRVRLDSGEIHYAGRRIDGMPPFRIARAGIGRTFQLTRVLARMSVIDNVRMGAMGHPGEQLRSVFGWRPAARRRERQVDERAREILRLVELGHLTEEYAGALSGGQRKLLEFARVLIAEPTLILLDEPMAGVNPVLGARLIDHVLAERDRRGTTFLIVEHDMDTVMTISDKVLVMHEGRLIAEGDPLSVQSNPAVVDAYLGAPAPLLATEAATS